MVILESALSLALVLGILVLLHEFGHFATAKLMGIRVETFSIGFGPRIFGWRRGDTEYRVSWIPLGGYVKMTGENPDEAVTGDPRELASRPRWQRFLVFVMGAFLNLVFAVVVMAVYFYRNGPLPETSYPMVREVASDSSLAKAGIIPGDRLVEVDGKDTRDPAVVRSDVFLSPGQTKHMVFDRGGQRIEADIEIGTDPKYRSGDLGIQLMSIEPEPTVDTNRIASVAPGSPAESAGLKPGDRIVAANGSELPRQSELVSLIQRSGDKTVSLGVLRGEERLTIDVVPKQTDEGVRIGVGFAQVTNARIRLSIAGAVAESLRFNYDNADAILDTLRRLITMQVSVRVMSGPAEIAVASRQAIQAGLDPFLGWLGFLSLQLGVINLMPIPMLDGGHIFILLVEGVLRRDLSSLWKERVMQAGLVFLLLFAGVVLFWDFVKLSLP